MKRPEILVAGIGNIFLGDDGFGCEVARRLCERNLPEDVRVVDFGIRGFDLAYALMDGYDVTIIVDATPRGGEAGTVYRIEPDLSEVGDEIEAGQMIVETHGMNPMKVLAMVKMMGGGFKRILVVGCEPETFGPEEGQLGLSEKVKAGVEEAVRLIEELIAEIFNERRRNTTA
jgi:hydrogenase maturation protease